MTKSKITTSSKIVIRFPFRVVPAWVDDFRYHLAEWCYQDQWDTGRMPGFWRRQRLALELMRMRANLVGRLSCWAFDHTPMDMDPGNPEVGPRPQVVCTRCRKAW